MPVLYYANSLITARGAGRAGGACGRGVRAGRAGAGSGWRPVGIARLQFAVVVGQPLP